MCMQILFFTLPLYLVSRLILNSTFTLANLRKPFFLSALPYLFSALPSAKKSHATTIVAPSITLSNTTPMKWFVASSSRCDADDSSFLVKNAFVYYGVGFWCGCLTFAEWVLSVGFRCGCSRAHFEIFKPIMKYTFVILE